MLTPAAILDQSGEVFVESRFLVEQWWRSFFESSEDARVVCRSDGLVVKINPKAGRLLKLDHAATEGHF
jgi:PAS domain-containing protein